MPPAVTIRIELVDCDPQEALTYMAEFDSATAHWFLEHLLDGVPLTAAGHLPPEDVHGALAHIDPSWAGSPDAHEDQVQPVLLFRQAAKRTLAFPRGSGVLARSPRHPQWAPTPAGRAFIRNILIAQ